MVLYRILQIGLGFRLYTVLRIGCRHAQVRLHIAKTLVPTSEGIALTYRVGRCRSRLTLLYRLNLQHCTIPIVEGNGIFGLRFGFNFYRSYRTRVTAICHTHTTTGSPVVHYHGPILVHIDEVRIVEVDDKGILVCSGHEVHRILWRSAQRAIHVHILPFGRMVQVVGLAIVVADEGKLLACILAVGRDTELYVGLQSASSSSHRPRGSTLLMVGLRYMVERLIVQLGLRLGLRLNVLRIGCRHTQVRLHIAKTLVPTSEGIALTYRVGRCRSRLTLLYRLNLQHCTIPIVEGNGIFGDEDGCATIVQFKIIKACPIINRHGILSDSDT